MKRKEKSNTAREGMAWVHPNAAAIDIGATMHMAAVGADRSSEPVRSFGTFTSDLRALADWFAECGVTTVVMESTSVYWIPIYGNCPGSWAMLSGAQPFCEVRRVPAQGFDDVPALLFCG